MNEARQSMVQRLKHVERERDGLEDARAAAEAYLGKELECTDAQCTIYQASLYPISEGTFLVHLMQRPTVRQGLGSFS